MIKKASADLFTDALEYVDALLRKLRSFKVAQKYFFQYSFALLCKRLHKLFLFESIAVFKALGEIVHDVLNESAFVIFAFEVAVKN